MTRRHSAGKRELQARLHLSYLRLRRFPAQHTGMKRSRGGRSRRANGHYHPSPWYAIHTAAHGRARDSEALLRTHCLGATPVTKAGRLAMIT